MSKERRELPENRSAGGAGTVALAAGAGVAAVVAVVAAILWWPSPEPPSPSASFEAPIVLQPEVPNATPPDHESSAATIATAPETTPPITESESATTTDGHLQTALPPETAHPTEPSATEMFPSPANGGEQSAELQQQDAVVGPDFGQNMASGRKDLRTAWTSAGLPSPNWVDNVRAPASGSDILRLERPDGADCASSFPCYAGLAENRLYEGERIALALEVPAGNPYVVVDYFMANGEVAHLYPAPSPAHGMIEPEAYTRGHEAGSTLWIGDRRAGPVFDELKVGAPFGRELLLAVAAPKPLFVQARPAVEPAATYQDDLAQALANQLGQAVADMLPIETSAP